MIMRISKDEIRWIKDNISLLDVLSADFEHGNKFLLCPSHSERTPSCLIGDRYAKCFGCGHHFKDQIEFIMAYWHMDFRGAVDALKECRPSEKPLSNDREPPKKRHHHSVDDLRVIRAVNNLCCKGPIGKSGPIFESEWTNELRKILPVDKIKNPNQYTTAITCHDKKGRPVGWWLRASPGHSPKYLACFISGTNSPLYFYYQYHDSEFVFLVEGQKDALFLHRKGIPSMALCTSSLSPSQFALLDSPNRRVFVWLDNDEAGKRGTAAALTMLSNSAGIAWPPEMEYIKDQDELQADTLIQCVDFNRDILGDHYRTIREVL
jgi:DNA primase